MSQEERLQQTSSDRVANTFLICTSKFHTLLRHCFVNKRLPQEIRVRERYAPGQASILPHQHTPQEPGWLDRAVSLSDGHISAWAAALGEPASQQNNCS